MLKRGFALFALLFIIVVYFVYPLSYMAMQPEVSEQLSPYSDDYNDVSLFKEDIEKVEELDDKGNKIGNRYDIYSIVASPTILIGPDVDPENTLYIAMGLEKSYTDDEANALLEFLRNGGHAILADDYGYLSEFARYYRVTYYRGKFFDKEFDRNENFTVVNAKLSLDQFTPYIPTEAEKALNETNTLMLNNLAISPPRDKNNEPIDMKWFDQDYPYPDGVWDSDQDGDGRVDEDPPEKGSPIDDDMDKAKSANDGRDNNNNGILDEEDPEEGLNEDHLDDDGDWIDLNRNGIQEPMVWVDIDNNGLFSWEDVDGDNKYDLDESEYLDTSTGEVFNEYVSGDFGVDEELFDGIDNDGDSIIDEDLRGYRLLFNDATGMTSQGSRIIAHGGTSDPPSYVNLDDIPGANTPTVGAGFSPDRVADEISSPGSEIQLIIEVLVCPECGGAVDIKTGSCLDTTSEFLVKNPCRAKHDHKDFKDFGSVVFISDSSLFLNDLYLLDHLATDDYTDKIYQIDEEGEIVDQVDYKEWYNAPHDFKGPSDKDKIEAQLEDERSRDYLVDQTPDGELDYDNKKFSMDLIKYLLPDGGMVIFDESRHYQENEFLIPVYSSIQVVTFLTSDPWYSSAMVIIFILLLSFAVIMVRKKENWVHRHNISLLYPRKSIPANKAEQMERLKWAILTKARLSRGLSVEEFQGLSAPEIDNIIKDPQLIEVVKNPNRVYTDDELKYLLGKISSYGK